MINHPGDIVQLNMGEGKTRVINPLLFLHWAEPSYSNTAPIVRLNFLSALIDEGYHFLHNTMCGSMIGRKLFLMPFDRDVQLTLENALVMRGCLERCRREGSAVVVAPEGDNPSTSRHLSWTTRVQSKEKFGGSRVSGSRVEL